MSYCSKCGTKVSEEMVFCPKCGASLKVQQAPAETVSPPAPQIAGKGEKKEKGEKEERRERMEKTGGYERREFAFLGPLVGGLILIFLGVMLYYAVTASFRLEIVGALFLVVIGIIIIGGAIYAATMATKRQPKT
jgi:hypothetical protein